MRIWNSPAEREWMLFRLNLGDAQDFQAPLWR